MSQTFEDFIIRSNPNIPILDFTFNLILAAILSILLSYLYIKKGRSLSNRKQFSQIFLLLSMTTMLMITIVKSSLALSLGLVGALSIIRFRAAIKEPEELTYLFLSIALGLGLGANQTIVTVFSFLIISLVIIIKDKFLNSQYNNHNLHLIIQSKNVKDINTTSIMTILNKYCDRVDLRRLDEANKNIELSFLIESDTFEQFNKAKNEIQKLDDSIKITFMDNKGII